jgi:type IV pilus assembly protein PilC
MAQNTLHISASTPQQGVQQTVTQKRSWLSIKGETWTDTVENLLTSFVPVGTKEKVQFFRLLATMINAGISITKALRILSDQTENSRMKRIVSDIAHQIETGSSFGEAVNFYSDIFSSAQIGMIEAGEASGKLNETLLQVAVEAEKSASIRSKIRGAMFYPVMIILLMLGAGFAIMVFVMPRIKELFDSLGGELPVSTKLLISISDFLVGTALGIPNALSILIFIALIIVGITFWKKTPLGGYLWAQLMLSMPIFGKLSQKYSLARFTRMLSTLSSSGIPIIKALHISASSIGNEVYERRVNQIAEDVKQGITMAENMKDDERHFPSMVVGMIAVGEQTAQIDTICGKIADYYEDEVNDMVRNLSSLLEPIIMLILGLAVAFLVLSVMLPILQSSDLAFSQG